MVHKHQIFDTDSNFSVDLDSRAVTNTEMKKVALMQKDHNSERFTFKMDRYIEGHDMSLCNKVEVHYDNADSGRNKVNHGVYTVEDLTVCADDENKIIFSWLISENATTFAGSLNFLISFTCVDREGNVLYRWNTGINNTISITAGINNGESVVEIYADVLEKWKNEFFDMEDSIKSRIETKGQQTLESIPEEYSVLQNEVDELHNSFGEDIIDLVSEFKKRCNNTDADSLHFDYSTDGSITVTHTEDLTEGNGGVTIPLDPSYNVVSFDIFCVNASPSIGFKCTDTVFFHTAIYEKSAYTSSNWEHVEYVADPVGIKNLIDAGADWNFYMWNAVPCNKDGYFIIRNLKFNGYMISPLYTQHAKLADLLKPTLSAMNFGLGVDYPVITHGRVDSKDGKLKVSVDNNAVMVEVVDNTYTGNGGYSYTFKDIDSIDSIDFDVYSSNSPINIGILSSDYNRIIYADDLVNVGRPVIYNDKHFHFEIPKDFKDYVKNSGLSAMFFIWNGPKCDICPRKYIVKNIVFNTTSNFVQNISKYEAENVKYYNMDDYTSFRYYANAYDTFVVASDNISFSSTSEESTMTFIFLTSDLKAENLSQLLYIEFDAKGVTDNDSKLYIWGTAKNSMEAANHELTPIVDGEVRYVLDLAWVDVYTNIDISKPFRIQTSAKRPGLNASFNNVKVYCKKVESDLMSPDGSTIYDIVENIEERFMSGSSGDIEETDKKYMISPNGAKYVLQVSDTGTLISVPVIPDKALVIGNSLTLGFGTFGMAASDSSHDYYYYINKAITENKPGTYINRVSGSDFEACTSDAEYEAWLSTIETSLTPDLDLVILQLMDNVNTEDRHNYFMSTGCLRLFKDVRSKCPKARVVWVGYWYSDSVEWNHVVNCAKATGCETVYFGDLYLDDTNKSAVGNTYTTDDGKVNTITSSGVASHPGDKGMRLIANRILYELGISDSNLYFKEE